MSDRKCVNIHNGTPGIITTMDGEQYVLYNDRQGNIHKTLYSPLTWQEDTKPPRHFPKAAMLQIAYEADKKLLQVHGVSAPDWLSLHPEQKRAWIEGSVDFMSQGVQLGALRKEIYNKIMLILEPLWKEA
jgi:hypothetical protein